MKTDIAADTKAVISKEKFNWR